MPAELSITTDYHVTDSVPRELQCRRMAAAGFRWAHWCWDWSDNILYQQSGCQRIAAQLAAGPLRLLDTHGAQTADACADSPDEAVAARGIRLQEDRLRMTAMLGGDAVVIHPPGGDGIHARLARLECAIAEWEPFCRRHGIRIAIENTGNADINRLALQRLFTTFDADIVGFAWDCGHGNLAGDNEWLVDNALHRLAALHLHDNDGRGDQHRLPGMGTVDWDFVADAIRAAGYAKPINFELNMSNSGFEDEEVFLAEAHRRGRAIFP